MPLHDCSKCNHTDEWTYLFTYDHLNIYGYGRLRIAIHRKTGRKVASYVV